jgi:hypothetical protein
LGTLKLKFQKIQPKKIFVPERRGGQRKEERGKRKEERGKRQ